MVAKCLTYENWEGGRIPQADEDEESVWDAFTIVEACVAACRNLYDEDFGSLLPRGMDLRIQVDGSVYLVWESDSHVITLKLVAKREGWTTRCNEGKALESPGFSAILDIAGDQLETSPRVAAAVAASPTLQAQGWD